MEGRMISWPHQQDKCHPRFTTQANKDKLNPHTLRQDMRGGHVTYLSNEVVTLTDYDGKRTVHFEIDGTNTSKLV
eukprot:15279830-Heterocapsa_arctica.AAC.1